MEGPFGLHSKYPRFADDQTQWLKCAVTPDTFSCASGTTPDSRGKTGEVGIRKSQNSKSKPDSANPTSTVTALIDDVIHGTWLKILKALAAIRTRVRFKRAKPVKGQQSIAHTHQRKRTNQ